jgi:hypothetical protein
MSDRPLLEAPDGPEALYRARGLEVAATRPISTGDVFALGESTTDGLVIVLTHPCSLRRDGVNLVDAVLVASIAVGQPISYEEWASGFFKKMPLPELLGSGTHHVAEFDNIGPCKSAELTPERRCAVLSDRGVNLLLQRLVHHMTRVAVPSEQFSTAFAGPMAELEIVEDWAEEAASNGLSVEDAASACHEWLRQRLSDGRIRQELLEVASERSAVRRDVRSAMAEWRDDLL